MVQMMNTGSNLGASAGGAQRVNFLITAANMTGPAVMGAMANLQGLSAISMRMGNQLGSTLTSVEGGILAVGAAGTIVAGMSSIMAAQYEAGMKQVQAISGATTQEMGYLSQQAKVMSMEFGMGFQELNEGLITLGRAGFQDTARQADVLREGIMLAKIEGMELETALESLITTTNLLHPELDMDSPQYLNELQKLNSQMAAVSQAAPISVNDIIQSLKYSGGIASEADIDQADLLGAIGYFGSKGVKGDVAGTALRALITRPASQTTQVSDALKEIGLTPESLWEEGGNKAKSIAEQIGLINDAMDKTGKSQMDRIEVWSNIVGPKQAQQMMKLDEEGIEQFVETAREGIDLEDKMNTIMESVQQKWNKFVEGVKTLAINVGDIFLQLIGPLIDGLNWLIQLLATNQIAVWTIAIGSMFAMIAGGIILFKWFGAAVVAVFHSMNSFIAAGKGKTITLRDIGIALGWVTDSESKALATGQMMEAQLQQTAAADRYRAIAAGEMVAVNGRYITSEEAAALEARKTAGVKNAASNSAIAAKEREVAAVIAGNAAIAQSNSTTAGTNAITGIGTTGTAKSMSNTEKAMLGLYSSSNIGALASNKGYGKINPTVMNVPNSLISESIHSIEQATEKGLENGMKGVQANKSLALTTGKTITDAQIKNSVANSQALTEAFQKNAGITKQALGEASVLGGAASSSMASEAGQIQSTRAIGGMFGNFWKKNFVDKSLFSTSENSRLGKMMGSSSKATQGLGTALAGLTSAAGIAVVAIVAIIAVFAIWQKTWSDKLNNAKDSLEKNQEAYEAARKSYDSRKKNIEKETEANKENSKSSEKSTQAIRKNELEMDKYQKKMELSALRIRRASREIAEAESDSMWGTWGVARQFLHALGQDKNQFESSSEGLYMEDRAYMDLMDYKNSQNKSVYFGAGGVGITATAIEKLYQAMTPPTGWSSQVENASAYLTQLYANPQYKNLVSLTNANYKYLSALYDVETEIMQTEGITKEAARGTAKFNEELQKVVDITGMTADQVKQSLDLIEQGQNLEAAQGTADVMKEAGMLEIDMSRPDAMLMKMQNNADNAWFSDSLQAALDNKDMLDAQLVMMAEKYAQDEAHEVWWQRSWILFENALLPAIIGVVAILEAIWNFIVYLINVGIAVYNVIAIVNNGIIAIQNAVADFASVFGVGIEKWGGTLEQKEFMEAPGFKYSTELADRFWANKASYDKLGEFNADARAQEYYNAMKVTASQDNRAQISEEEAGGAGTDTGTEDKGKTNKITVDFVTCRKQIIPKINQMSLFGNGPLIDVHKHTVQTGPINVITRDDPDAIGTAVDNRIAETAKDLYPVTVSTRGVSPTQTSSNPNIKTA